MKALFARASLGARAASALSFAHRCGAQPPAYQHQRGCYDLGGWDGGKPYAACAVVVEGGRLGSGCGQSRKIMVFA